MPLTFPVRVASRVLIVASLVGSQALANGRYPTAGQLVPDPVNPRHMVARTTFGMLDTFDGGATWTWICEAAVGYFSTEDPSIGVCSNGSTVAAWGGDPATVYVRAQDPAVTMGQVLVTSDAGKRGSPFGLDRAW